MGVTSQNRETSLFMGEELTGVDKLFPLPLTLASKRQELDGQPIC